MNNTGQNKGRNKVRKVLCTLDMKEEASSTSLECILQSNKMYLTFLFVSHWDRKRLFCYTYNETPEGTSRYHVHAMCDDSSIYSEGSEATVNLNERGAQNSWKFNGGAPTRAIPQCLRFM